MFGEAIAYVVETLRAADVSAADDPADLNTPGVWVTPDQYAGTTLDGGYQVDLNLYLVAGSRHTGQAIADLDALAATVTAAGFPVTEATAVTVTLPNHNTGGMPAYQTPIQLMITKEN